MVNNHNSLSGNFTTIKDTASIAFPETNPLTLFAKLFLKKLISGKIGLSREKTEKTTNEMYC